MNKTGFIIFVLFVTLLGAFIFSPSLSFASMSNHIVISEIQISGVTAGDEFIELYNPTDTDVNLSGYRLSKKTSGGTISNLLTNMSGIIPAHGYFLVAHPASYSLAVAPDTLYSTSNSLASDNTLILFADQGVTVLDKVGMGGATDFETVPILNPGSLASIERKANINSTVFSMETGSDKFRGNSEDTDNNSADFILRNLSEPQNSSSAKEYFTEPTLEPTLTPTPTPTLTPSATPTFTPTLTPTPLVTPSIDPSPTPIRKHLNPVFTCQNTKIPSWVYQKLLQLMPWKFDCTN